MVTNFLCSLDPAIKVLTRVTCLRSLTVHHYTRSTLVLFMFPKSWGTEEPPKSQSSHLPLLLNRTFCNNKRTVLLSTPLSAGNECRKELLILAFPSQPRSYSYNSLYARMARTAPFFLHMELAAHMMWKRKTFLLRYRPSWRQSLRHTRYNNSILAAGVAELLSPHHKHIDTTSREHGR